MRMRSLSYGIIILFSALFVLFIFVYQHYAVSTIRQKIAEHARVMEHSLWNYEETNLSYFILAAQANNYASIVIKDQLGLEHSEITGPAPKATERWLMALKLIPLYRFQADIEHAGEKIGTISVIWRCTTIYIYIYVGLCLVLLAIGIRLSIKLKFTNTQLETRNEQLQQEVAERQRVETALQQAHDQLEQRVRERTAELAEANEALRQSEQQFRDITKNIPGMVYQFRVQSDGSTYFSYASPRAGELFGLPDDLDSEDWELGAHLHPDDQQSFFASVSQAIEQYSDWNYEGRMLLPDDGMKWFQGISSPTRIGDELVFNGILLDITERKQAEQALQSSEERYRLVLDATNDGIWDWDIPTNTTYFSDRYYTMLGYAPGEFPATYESWRQLVHPDDLEVAEQTIQNHFMQKSEEYVTEFRLKTKQGDWKWIFSRGRVTERDEHGNPLRMIGTHVDITERKHAEQALREREQHYRTLIENMPIVCFTYDQHGTVLSWNKEAERVYGYTEEEAVRHSAYDLIVTPTTLEATKRVIQQVFDGQVVKGAEWQDRNKHGVIGWRFGNTFPLFHPDGSVKVGVNMNIDITEKKTAEEELTKYREQLEELIKERTEELALAKEQAEDAQRVAESANRAKSTFLANMSHELRTPLNAILGFSQLMARDPEVSASQRENLAIINRSGEHLLMLINSILDMSKIEAGRAELEATSFDLDRTLTSIEEMIRVRAEKKRLQFLVERDSDLPRYIKTDEGKLRQILINLLSNAVKFTEEGSVTLRISRGTHPPAPSLAKRGGEELPSPHRRGAGGEVFLQFSIEDTGIGILQNALEHIFEPFAQTSSGLQAAEGTGLGLAISRQFVRLLGGDITVTSQVGTGSVFTFAIQVEPVDMGQIEQQQTTRRVVGLAPDQRAADGRPYRILIVEDKGFNSMLLQRLLESVSPSANSGQGFEVRTAVNGKEALDIVEEWQPHLIWMDMRMPVMDGYTATREIRKAEEQKLRRAEGRRQKAEGGRQKAEGRRRKAEEQKLRRAEGEEGSIQHPASSIQFRIKIIALTASAFEEDRKKVLAAGCDDFVRKPFKEEEIFSMLEQYLGVQFVYEDEEVGAQGTVPVLTPEALAALPPDLLTNLEQATNRSDMQQIITLIGEIRTYDAAVADALQRLANEFQYDEMLSILSSMKK